MTLLCVLCFKKAYKIKAYPLHYDVGKIGFSYLGTYHRPWSIFYRGFDPELHSPLGDFRSPGPLDWERWTPVHTGPATPLYRRTDGRTDRQTDRHRVDILVQASNMSMMKNSMKLVWDLGTLHELLSNTGMTTGNPRAFSSSVCSQDTNVRLINFTAVRQPVTMFYKT